MTPCEGEQMQPFLTDTSGAVTVDWVVLTGGVVGLGLATISVVSGGIEVASNKVSGTLGRIDVTTGLLSIAYTNFATSIDGWSVTDNDQNTIAYNSGPGSDGEAGFLTWTDLETNYSSVVLPEDFTGDLTDAIGGSLSYDITLLQEGNAGYITTVDLPTVEIEAADGTIIEYITDYQPQLGQWDTVSASLDANSWVSASGDPISEADLQAVLSDVSEVRLRAEYMWNQDITGFDNVRLNPGG